MSKPVIILGRDMLKDAGAPAYAPRQCWEILLYSAALRLEIDDDFRLVPSKTGNFSYDFLSWREDGYEELPLTGARSTEVAYDFRLGDQQKLNLERQLALYKSDSLTTTLRMLSVYMNPDDLFYKVEPMAAGHEG